MQQQVAVVVRPPGLWPRVLERLFGPQLPQQLRLELTRDLGRAFVPFLIVAVVAAALAIGVAVTVRSTFAMFFAGLGIAGFGFILLACQTARRPLDSELQDETEARYGLGTTVVATALGGIVVSVLATDASMVLQAMVVMVALAALGVGSTAWRGRPVLAVVQALSVSVPTAAALALRWPVPAGYATALGVLIYGMVSMVLARRGYRAQLALIEARDDQRAERNRMRVAMEHMGQAVAVLDTALNVVMINRSALDLLGLERVDDVNPPRFDDMLSAAPNLVKASGNQEELLAQADLLITARQPFNGVLRLNDDRVIDLECLPIPDGGWVAMLRDSTGERHAIAELNREIRRCPLTGLPNRRGFLEELERRLARGEAFALMIVDLDGFKQVNDRHGHSVGDRMITRIGFRLRTADPALYAARLGGDEFAVLAEIESGDAAVALAQRLVDTIDAPARFGEAEVQVGAAIGVAMAPDDGVLVETLLRAADLALLAAKAQPGNQIRLFTVDLLEKSAQIANLEARVRSALRNGRVDVAYQPLVELATGKVVAVEALARWRDDGGALVSPEQLVAVAEARGLVSDLRRLVLNEAAATIAAHGGTLDLWVNASVHDLRQPGMVGEVTATLAAAGLSPSRLAVEITETALMTEEDGCNANLSALNALGVTVAMDDFGAGFSSLDRLRRLPINALKISGSLLHGAAEDRLAGDIFRMAASLGRAMGLTLIAEGVETEAELSLARANGIDRGQGYLLAAPVPADQLPAAISAAEQAARGAVWLRATPAKQPGKRAAAAKPATRPPETTPIKAPAKAPAKAPETASAKPIGAAKADQARAGKTVPVKAAAAVARAAPAKAAAVTNPPPKAVAPAKAPPKTAAPVKAPLKAAAPVKAPLKAAAAVKAPLTAVAPAKAPPKAVAPTKAPLKAVAPAKPPLKAVAAAKAPPKAASPVKAPLKAVVAPAKPPLKAVAPAMAPPKAAAKAVAPAKASSKAAAPAKIAPPVKPQVKAAAPAKAAVPARIASKAKPGTRTAVAPVKAVAPPKAVAPAKTPAKPAGRTNAGTAVATTRPAPAKAAPPAKTPAKAAAKAPDKAGKAAPAGRIAPAKLAAPAKAAAPAASGKRSVAVAPPPARKAPAKAIATPAPKAVAKPALKAETKPALKTAAKQVARPVASAAAKPATKLPSVKPVAAKAAATRPVAATPAAAAKPVAVKSVAKAAKPAAKADPKPAIKAAAPAKSGSLNGKPNGNGNGHATAHAKTKVDPAPRGLKMVATPAPPVRARRKPAAQA